MKTNYFFSGWIENFGVVPLFFIWALRFLPMFFLRISRRTSVIRVFETMAYLLLSAFNRNFLRFKYLPLSTLSVKSILLLKFFLHIAPCQAVEISTPSQLFLAIGEHAEINIPKGNSFTVGNKEVIAVKSLSGANKLVIKALRQGFSELALLNKQMQKHSIKIFVTNKLQKMNLISSLEEIKNMNLESQVNGQSIYIKGEITDFSDYLRLHSMKSDLKDEISLEVSLHPKLKRDILEKVYRQSILQNNKEFFCEIHNIQFYCFYDETKPITEEIKKRLIKDFALEILPRKSKSDGKNFRLKLKIIQMENSSGQEINWGLSEIDGTLEEFFTSGVRGIVAKNAIALRQHDLSLSTLAEPILLMQVGDETKIEIGTELPYQNRKGIDWKFAGLKITLNLKRIGRELRLNYHTELGRPISEGQISSSRQSSSFKVSIGTPLEIYQIGYETNAKNVDMIPGVGEIPIIGELFKGKGSGNVYKKISAIVLLEEVVDE